MRIAIIGLIILTSAAAWADTVTLKDGTRVQGDLKRTETGYDLIGPAGDVTHLASDNIQSIELGNAISPESPGIGTTSSAADRLASLKRSVDQVDDLSQIIARYKQFIAQVKDASPDVAKQAEEQLAIWQGRADQKLVKVSGTWMSADQKQRMMDQAADVAKQGYDLMRQNKVQDADAVVKKVLAIDPQNPIANYLQGVLLYQQDKLVPSRKSFEIVNAQIHGDAATLNNLGVIAWRQGQVINALNFYYDAMLAMPANKEILTNVAEALTGVPANLQKQFVVQKAQRLFAGQEANLETTMAQYGWYRWGSMWIDRSQLDGLKAAANENKAKIDSLQKQFDAIQKQISDNNATISKDDDNMQDLVNRSYYTDANGNSVQAALPNIYYTLQAEANRLAAENQTLDSKKQPLRDEAQHVDASTPKPRFTGIQQLIGAEGTPMISVAAAATQPASPSTQPANNAPVAAAPTPQAPTTQPATSQPPLTPSRSAPAPAAPAPATPEPPTTNRVF